MKGDFTRFTHRPSQGYSSVMLQQGRVLLDADWNEQRAISLARERTFASDAIGRAGGPIGATGFAVSVVRGGAGLELSAGRYYVDGILCELERPTSISEQPSMPGIDPTRGLEPGHYAVYLDVWERHVTHIEDPAIKEKALGGPDHTTRSQVVAQVKFAPIRLPEDDCPMLAAPAAFAAWIEEKRGRMSAAVDPTPADADPCLVPPEAGYRGLENQLYRVEIHRPGDGGEVTFKWSRDNGSVVTAWTGTPDLDQPNRIEVSDLGDAERGFRADGSMYVEVCDDTDDLRGTPGILARLIDADEASRTLTLAEPVNAKGDPVVLVRGDDAHHPRVRRWDGSPRRIDDVDVNEDGIGWITLEYGIRVRFELGAGQHYRPGDHWLIPARTIDGSIDWQPNELQEPHGIDHHYACLAAVTLERTGTFILARSHQHQFPAATELTQLRYVAGDGQQGVLGQTLPTPLIVQVMNGSEPVAGAWVQFEILDGRRRDGALTYLDPAGAERSAFRVRVATDSSGLARVTWKLASKAPADEAATPIDQRVQATLRDGCQGQTPQVVEFSAHEAQASEVRYAPACSHLQVAGVDTVQGALDALCLDRTLYYVTGTGQAVRFGKKLPVPLTVRVANEGQPIAGASVRFSIVELSEEQQGIDEKSGGTLSESIHGSAQSVPWEPGLGTGTRTLLVKSDADGVASVIWTYGTNPGPGVPGVRAVLLDAVGNATTSVIRFSAAVHQGLTVITALSWQHNQKGQKLVSVKLPRLPVPNERPAIVFRFSGEVCLVDEDDKQIRQVDAHRVLEVLARNAGELAVCRCSLRGHVVPLLDPAANSGPLDGPFEESRIGDTYSTLWAFAFDEPPLGGQQTQRELFVRLRGDFVLTGPASDPRALDANFLLGRLPTGDGVEGGLFESWFWIGEPQ
jgi:hypothetical protein